MSSISFISSVSIDTSGKNGKNGMQGTNGMANGSSGYSGTKGTNGEPAKDINLHLDEKDGVIHVKSGNHLWYLRLGDGLASIFLKAIGGTGGEGGKGGTGGRGTDGMRGSNATQYSSGSSGSPGGSGGHGGDGGPGGDGGRGGNIKIHLSPKDTDLLMLLNTPEVSGGKGGQGGSGGQGGHGGYGGQGGSSYSWTEYSNGHSMMRTNMGGSQGLPGSMGTPGLKGKEGKSGSNGSFEMTVGDTTYPGLYDLKVSVAKIVDIFRGNPEGIYEPNEVINLKVTVTNIGKMPTPHREIIISLLDVKWIDRKHSSLTLDSTSSLPKGASFTFSHPFSFHIKNIISDSQEPFDTQKLLLFDALLCRVNKSFTSVQNQKNSFPVRYPIHLSSLEGKISITKNETGVISLKVKSITPISMGLAGDQKRRIYVIFDVSNEGDVKSSDVALVKTRSGDHQEQNKVCIDIDRLEANSEQKVGVNVTFTNKNLPSYSKVRILASLFLDYFSSGNETEPVRARCIQKRTIDIQLTEAYQFHPHSDILLVTHAGVSKEQHQAWKDQFNLLNLIYSIWNASYQNGINFAAPIEGSEETLQQQFKDKTVIILNETFRGPVKNETMASKLPKNEIFRIGSHFNIKTYILGEKGIKKEQFYPSKEEYSQYHKEPITGRFLTMRRLGAAFDKKVTNLSTLLHKINPMQKYMLHKSFQRKKIDGIFKYQLGTVVIIPKCLFNNPTIFYSLLTNINVGHITSLANLYGIVKMVPFAKKLSLLEKASSEASSDIIEKAILSDLADEQSAFSQDRWTGEWGKDKIRKKLDLLNAFAITAWSKNISQNTQLKSSVKNIMLQFRAFVKSIPHSKLDFLPFRRQRLLKNVSVKIIDNSFKNTFAQNAKDTADFKAHKTLFSQASDIWAKIRNPYNFVEFYQDNWQMKTEYLK